MIFLIAKIFVYMLLALAAGAAAGWLWRHRQAAQQEGALERALMDARSRLPQMETALRSRDERIDTMARDIQEYRSALTGHEATAAARDRTVADLERSCAELRQRLEQTPGKPAGPAPAEDGDEISLHPGDPEVRHEAAAAGGAAPAQAETPADGAAGTLDTGEREALEAALDDARTALEETRTALAEARAEADQARAEAEQAREAMEGQDRDALEATQAALAAEQRKVAELSRERDLQHRALRALEQRLELAEERRAANG